MDVLCPKEMAGKLGVSARTITRYLGNGEIEGFKVGPKWRSTNLDVEAYMVRKKLEQRKICESKRRIAHDAVAAKRNFISFGR